MTYVKTPIPRKGTLLADKSDSHVASQIVWACWQA